MDGGAGVSMWNKLNGKKMPQSDSVGVFFWGLGDFEGLGFIPMHH
jgi:hypothetical protein